jgi:hypothetical protein
MRGVSDEQPEPRGNVLPLDDGSTLSFALGYIHRGWRVFPIKPGSKQPDTTLCPQGHKNATNSADVARSWWAGRDDLGIGIALRASGLLCVDVDPRNGGMETLDALDHQHGQLDADVLALSGGGGPHYYFLNEDGANYPANLGPGVDCKSDGYMVAPPSVHPLTGRRYCWEDSADPMQGMMPGPPPPWLRDMSRAPAAPPAPLPAAPVSTIEPARLASLLEALPFVDANPREAWLSVGMGIHNEMPGHDGFELWAQWSSTSPKFDLQDQVRVWRSMRHRGLHGTTLNTVFAMAQHAGWRNTGGNVFSLPTPADELVLDVLQLEARSRAVRWAVKGMVPAASLGLLFGASGTFKSFVALDFQLHLAYGMPWCGRRTISGVPVFLAAEGGPGLIRRIKAWHIARAMDWRACALRVVVVPMLLLRQAKALADAIASAGVQPADIVVDTMSQTFDGNENAADEVAAYLRAIRVHLVERFGCSVTVIHHSGHSATERPRGSSALQANVDFMFGVFRPGGDSMLTTVECIKVKDGEKFRPVDFALSSHELGTDEDGDPITSLAATFVDNAAALIQSAENKIDGHRRALLDLVPAHGIDERELRKAFYAVNETISQEARQKAFVRALSWALEARLLLRNNYVIEQSKPVDNSSQEAWK